jgi:hypothetical protein
MSNSQQQNRVGSDTMIMMPNNQPAYGQPQPMYQQPQPVYQPQPMYQQQPMYYPQNQAPIIIQT